MSFNFEICMNVRVFHEKQVVILCQGRKSLERTGGNIRVHEILCIIHRLFRSRAFKCKSSWGQHYDGKYIGARGGNTISKVRHLASFGAESVLTFFVIISAFSFNG